jgi:hypothetical protein
MQYFRLSLLIFFSFVSSVSRADTYPATAVTTFGYMGNSYTSAQLCQIVSGAVAVYNSSDGWCYVNGGKYDAIGFGIVSYSCTNGGTSDGSGNCINAPACPSGTTRNSDGSCTKAQVIQDCPAGQYKDQNNTCQVAPDCNSGRPDGGNYFSVSTGQCQGGHMQICIARDANDAGGKFTMSCPAAGINDCLPAGSACIDFSNTTVDINALAANRAAAVAAIKTQEAIDKANMDMWKDKVAQTVQDKSATAQASEQAAKDSQAAASQASSGAGAGTPAALATQQAAASAAVRAATDAQALSNAQSQQSSFNQQYSAASSADSAFSGDIGPNQASDAAAQVKAASQKGQAAAAAAINGTASDGSSSNSIVSSVVNPYGSGGGSGNSSGSSGSSNNQNPTYSMSYTDSATVPSNAPDSFYTSKYSDGLTGVWNSHKQQLNNSQFMQSLSSLNSGVPDQGSCPTWSMDLTAMRLGVVNLSVDCNIFGYIKIFVLLTAAFACRAIIFGG